MSQFQLPNITQSSDVEPLIISYADSNHYLAGYEDEGGNFHSLNCEGKTVTFNSIREAEVAFKTLGVCSANVELQTAYDEMIGNDASRHCRYTVNF